MMIVQTAQQNLQMCALIQEYTSCDLRSTQMQMPTPKRDCKSAYMLQIPAHNPKS